MYKAIFFNDDIRRSENTVIEFSAASRHPFRRIDSNGPQVADIANSERAPSSASPNILGPRRKSRLLTHLLNWYDTLLQVALKIHGLIPSQRQLVRIKRPCIRNVVGVLKGASVTQPRAVSTRIIAFVSPNDPLLSCFTSHVKVSGSILNPTAESARVPLPPVRQRYIKMVRILPCL